MKPRSCLSFVLILILEIICFFTTKIDCTCISAIKCIDGVVIASDSLAVSGSLVGNRETIKIKQLTNNVVICCAAGFKLFQQLFDDLESDVKHHRLSYQSELSIQSIANYIRRKLYSRSNSDTHILVIGIDSPSSDPHIFEVLPGGSLVSHDFVVAGPASGNLFPLLLELCHKEKRGSKDDVSSNDDNRKDINLPMMGTLEAFDVVNKILEASRTYDPQSGGPIKRFLLKRNGRLLSVKRSRDLASILVPEL